MSAKLYRKLPVTIQAVQFVGTAANAADIRTFAGNPDSIDFATDVEGRHIALSIQTLEGVMTASVGDFIIRGVQGELYPCKPAIFGDTYEEVAA
nr:hypothetical protein [Rhodococcus sp. (in: high G+C Gram-positive bacteria)]